MVGRLVTAAVMNQLLAAMNAHDLDAFVACFAPHYRSEQPAHPSRAFYGSDQVRENWASVFAGVPDFNAELVVSSSTDRRDRDRRVALVGDPHRWFAFCNVRSHGDGHRG